MKRVLRAFFQISSSYYYDLKNYIKYSSSINFTDSKEKLEGRICVFYHALEKGLSLPNPKDGFGEQKAIDLIKLTLIYIKLDNHSLELLSTISGVLKKYFEYNSKSKNIELTDCYREFLKLVLVEASLNAGLSQAYKSTLSFTDYSEFVTTRRSIRDFKDVAVSRSRIEECVKLARYTPSVCNRQPWKVYIYQGKAEVTNALSLQHGNKGFCDDLNSLILVTVDRAKFWHALERNQAYIDGGMFSMSIVNALHASGLGCCCLNMSLTAIQESKLKSELNIDASEIPIMMITVSEYDNGAKVASSERLPLELFLGN